MIQHNRVGRVSLGGQMIDPNTQGGSQAIVDMIKSGRLARGDRGAVVRLVEALDLRSRTTAGVVADALYNNGYLNNNFDALKAYIDKINPNGQDGRERIQHLKRDSYFRSYPEFLDTLRTKADPEKTEGANSIRVLESVTGARPRPRRLVRRIKKFFV